MRKHVCAIFVTIISSHIYIAAQNPTNFSGGHAVQHERQDVVNNTLPSSKFIPSSIKLDKEYSPMKIMSSSQSAITFGGTNDDYANCVAQTADGGYIIAGVTNTYGAGMADMYVAKLDNTGSMQWTKSIGGTGNDFAKSVVQTTDGGFVIAGGTYSFGADSADVYLVKLNSVGALEWTKTIGGTNDDWANSVIQSTDGGIVACGISKSFGTGVTNAYVLKTDDMGNIKWTKTFGSTDGDEGYSITQTQDGGYALGGMAYTCSICLPSGYVVKMDGAGNMQSTSFLQTLDINYGVSSIAHSSDGGYVVTGSAQTNDTIFVYIIKFDNVGGTQWAGLVGGSESNFGNSIVQTLDGGYVLAGATNSFGAGGYDVYAFKLNSAGNSVLWTRTFGGINDEEIYSIVQTTDGGYALAGQTKSFGSGSMDAYFLKLDATAKSCVNNGTGFGSYAGPIGVGTLTITTGTGGVPGSGGILGSGGSVTQLCAATGIEDITEEMAITVFPNPTTGTFSLEINSTNSIGIEKMDAYRIDVYNIYGEKKYSGTSENKSIAIDLHAPSGVYFLRINSKAGQTVKKIIINN